MKNLILAAMLLLSTEMSLGGTLENTIHPYISKNAIGLRFFLGIGGQNTSYSDFEVSYQRHIYRNIRAAINTSLGFGGGTFFSFVPEIDAVWKIIEGLNIYTGGAFGYIHNSRVRPERNLIGIGPNLGLEYNFSDIGAPIILSVGKRPLFFTTEVSNNPLGNGLGLAIRYTF